MIPRKQISLSAERLETDFLSFHVLLIKGGFPGSEGDYVIVREAKKISIGSARLKQIHDARRKAKEVAAGKKDEKKAAAAAAKKVKVKK